MQHLTLIELLKLIPTALFWAALIYIWFAAALLLI
jgi:hypothetical protein